MSKITSLLTNVFVLIIIGAVTRFGLLRFLEAENSSIQWLAVIGVMILGIYLIRSTASIIGDTTGVLKDRTGLAGGLLQSFGTAFPDMVIGVVSAVLSLQAAQNDPLKAVNLAIIAASTTFGSNIYNIFHATYCIYRQNKANGLNKPILMFKGLPQGGEVKPFTMHTIKPSRKAMDTALHILGYLSMLTTLVALGMVLFGKIATPPQGFGSDLYQLNRPVGIIVFIFSVVILYMFRKNLQEESAVEENKYSNLPSFRIWGELVLAGGVILMAAESVIEAVTVFSALTHIPLVITGVATALIGCLGEMLVVHDFTIHPHGRIADAITGVAMDNIVTTLGAAFIAIMGGIFLGSDALIVIFVMVLFANTTLMYQIALLKNFLVSK